VATDIKQSMKDAIFTDASNPMDLKQANDKQQVNDKQDKKQVEGEAQIADVEVADVTDNRGTEGLAADIILPAIMPVEQGKTVANNLTSADAINEDVLSSFIKLPTGNAKPNQPTKALDDALQSKAIFRQPIQDKQGFNFKYFENAAQTEKTGPVEKQAVSLEAEKSLPRVGDMTQLNKPVVDNKVDVPAITKPLSHPEWNKDLGDRIVWMSSRAIPAAEIKLNPQHLGPISVRVNVTDDQATVVFTAQHAATREALEASIPKLREMMSAQQLNLVEVNVSHSATSDQGRSQSQNFAQTADGRGQGSAVAVDGVDDVEQEIETGRAVVSKGLLSIYA
jgi:flagellar hook-length control protein FliK